MGWSDDYASAPGRLGQRNEWDIVPSFQLSVGGRPRKRQYMPFQGMYFMMKWKVLGMCRSPKGMMRKQRPPSSTAISQVSRAEKGDPEAGASHNMKARKSMRSGELPPGQLEINSSSAELPWACFLIWQRGRFTTLAFGSQTKCDV